MSRVDGDRLAESVEGTWDLFIGKQTGETEAAVIVDGDMETLDASAWIAPGLRLDCAWIAPGLRLDCAWIALGSVTRGADAGPRETAQLLDVEVEKSPWRSRS